ncbi:MAG TPA: ABC transporter substrate binding protein [Geobacteraceae bacterium]
MISRSVKTSLFILVLLFQGLFTPACFADDVLVIADGRLAPAHNIISGIRKSLHASIRVFSPAEARDSLGRLVEKEKPRVVVALGREALNEALRLPPTIPVIYDMVVVPPQIARPNTTGFYMAVPVSEYAELLRNYLYPLKKIAVVGRREQLNVLASDTSQKTTNSVVGNAFELVEAVRQVKDADAILLLPDAELLSAVAMEEVFLISFRRKVPLLGISEKQVKDGALLALVVDTEEVGRRIGEYAGKAMRGVNMGLYPPSPPKRFELFLNRDTAKKMGIHLSGEMLRMAKRAYP